MSYLCGVWRFANAYFEIKREGVSYMDKKIECPIRIPAGCFEGNCSDCRYANWNDTKDGKPYCEGGYGGYNRPSDRNGCFHHS